MCFVSLYLSAGWLVSVTSESDLKLNLSEVIGVFILFLIVVYQCPVGCAVMCWVIIGTKAAEPLPGSSEVT